MICIHTYDVTPDGVEVCSQWSSLAMFTQLTVNFLGGAYIFFYIIVFAGAVVSRRWERI